MNKWIELLLGLILVVVPILLAWYSQMWGAFNFWDSAWIFLKGGIFWFVLMIGLLFILLGISDLKEASKPAPRPRPHPSMPHPGMPPAMHSMPMSTPVVDMTSQASSSTAKKRKK